MPGHSDTGKKTSLLFLALGALGVVYGDIGTSPLYALKEIFFGHALKTYTSVDVYGALSFVFWALAFVVAFKYVFIVLRADYDGEGGVFALYGLVHEVAKKKYSVILTLLIVAAGLLYGDGIITPAISVISAVEGLNVLTHTLEQFIVPITIIILTVLFMIQFKGTGNVGKIFGPVMFIWFLCIGLLGLNQIFSHPEILQAINPWYAWQFLTHHELHTITLVLGSVMLVITGGEAMYADMGHFGRLPIRVSWYIVAFPALLLSYFGQGSFLLSGKEVVAENIFFSMVPEMFLVPMVILATLATVIASQALISGAFSLTKQAVSLGLLPYIHTSHTDKHHEGQIYISFVNWALYVGSVALVLYFQSSSGLAAAYGLAVSGVMFVTTLGILVVAKEKWKWKKRWIVSAGTIFLLVDSAFLFANTFKILQGGYIPLLIAFGVLTIITTWQWGRAHVKKRYDKYPVQKIKDIIEEKESGEPSLPRAMIVMTPQEITSVDDDMPMLKQIFWERYGLIPRDIIFLTVMISKKPHMKKERYTVRNIYSNKHRGSITSVTVHFGFLEDPNVEKVLKGLVAREDVPLDPDNTKWLIHVVHERILSSKISNIFTRLRFSLYSFIQRNTDTADRYFGLGDDEPLTIEVLPVYFK